MSGSGKIGQDGNPANVHLLPYGHDQLEYIASHIIDRCRDTLPDLGDQVILLANPLAAPRLRKLLLDRASHAGCHALLGPHITSLHDWVDNHTPARHNRLTSQERLLILLTALRQHSNLPGAEQPWLLADNLLNLFDELECYHVEPGDDFDSFSDRLAQAYGKIPRDNPAIQGQLSREAQLVFTLWQAWREQLDNQQCVDAHQDYRDRLATSLASTPGSCHFWLAGYDHFIPAELDWLRHMLQRNTATLLMHGDQQQYPGLHPGAVTESVLRQLAIDCQEQDLPRSHKSQLLDAIFDNRRQDFVQRARAFHQHCDKSPLQQQVSVLHTENEEQQALAVDLQIRLWLQQGHKSIGIVTQDRRLARRVRALLERAGILLQDSAGWALSTTSAAAALERWLECIEQDFEYIPLLDLLKSAYIAPGFDDDNLRQYVYRFEQDIVLREGITSNLGRYQAMLESRHERLQGLWTSNTHDRVTTLLSCLQQAAAPLLPFRDAGQHDAGAWLDSLIDSLRQLGMHEKLHTDTAGARILEEIEHLRSAALRHPVKMRWYELRSWLARSLERYTFKPALPATPVQLLDLMQARLMRFDAVIIAAADRRHLPGMAESEPFFNEAVRLSLGLPGREHDSQRRLHAFRALLEHAGQVLITADRLDMNADPVLDSPWLEALTRFHQLAYGDDLEDKALANLLAQHGPVLRDQRPALPGVTQPPAPTVAAPLRAERISATDYQNLVECPYRYYASRCLGLHAPDEIREVLAKNELGERIHRCLQAFHSQVDYLPPPFGQPVTAANRVDAITHLETISSAVFARDIEAHFEHRTWLNQWRQTIPAYIDWQIVRNTHWQVQLTEQQADRSIDTISLPLHGRLDRIDHGSGGYAIVDYKTGRVAAEDDVANGEAVQLPFYVLLYPEPVGQVEYLAIDLGKHTVESKSVLQGPELDALVAAHTDRLAYLAEALRAGKPLPAYANPGCEHCDMDGLCRVEYWPDNDEVPA